MKEKLKTNKKEIAIISIILTILLIFSFTIGRDIIDIAQDPKQFQSWIDEFGVFGQMIMILLVFAQIVIAWLPGEIFEIGAGYAFGFWQGSFLVLLGSLFASTCVMLLVRRYGRNLVYHFFDKEKVLSLPLFHDEGKMDRFIFIAFFIPGTPKDILTYAVGLTDMKVSHFILLSTIGRIPSVITSTFTGSALGASNPELAIFSFLFTVLISATGLWGYGWMNKRAEDAQHSDVFHHSI